MSRERENASASNSVRAASLFALANVEFDVSVANKNVQDEDTGYSKDRWMNRTVRYQIGRRRCE